MTLKQSTPGTALGAEIRQVDWKKRYDGLLPEILQLKQLEDENAALEKVAAHLRLDNEMLQDIICRRLRGSNRSDAAKEKEVLFSLPRLPEQGGLLLKTERYEWQSDEVEGAIAFARPEAESYCCYWRELLGEATKLQRVYHTDLNNCENLFPYQTHLHRRRVAG
jgi:hypothetical protein